MWNYQGRRNYQMKFPTEGFPKRFFKAILCLCGCLLLLLIGIQCFKVDLLTDYFYRSPTVKGCSGEKGIRALDVVTKRDLRGLINLETLCNNPDCKIDINYSGKLFSVETTLDKGFQSYMLKAIQHSHSPLIGFVAMDPQTGRILSMIDSTKTKGEKSVCLSSRFPAASIFKIISAAAAIDRCNISGDTELTYNGAAHTLYKNQLTDRINRYTNSISLKSSFAKSINPVFGKLGISYLKKDLIEEYAIRFGFNQPIDFELPVEQSRISVSDEPYHWAELACGFNRATLISPIHAAMIGAAIVNDGRLVEPTIIELITDDEKNPVYVGGTNVMRQAISPKVSREMKELMAATITRGTCRTTFKRHRRDPVLSKLSIGGKTGSINNKTDELHYDWFVGFCEEKVGTQKLALAVLVVHDTLLREKSHKFAHHAMRYYFKESRAWGTVAERG